MHGRSPVADHALGLAQEAGPSVTVDVQVEPWSRGPCWPRRPTGAHLLVLGSRGHGAALSLLLGSVSVALAAHAPCPVVVVRPAAIDGAAVPVVGASTVRPTPPAP